MALLTRIVRLFKADLHGIIDQIENRELLLKQHLRDMQGILLQKEARFNQMCRARDLARQDYEKGDKECTRLEADLGVALKNDKDDIGRMLIRKLKPLNEIQAGRRRHIDRLMHDIKEFRSIIENQRMQYEKLQQKAAEYLLRSGYQMQQDLDWTAQSGLAGHDLNSEEIELELLQRKAAFKGGTHS